MRYGLQIIVNKSRISLLLNAECKRFLMTESVECTDWDNDNFPALDKVLVSRTDTPVVYEMVLFIHYRER